MIDIISLDGLHQLPAPAPSTQARLTGDVSRIPGAETWGTDIRGGDIVEISNEALALSRATETSSLRMARNNAIRSEIQSGSYETPERLAKTVERLLDVLG